MLKNPCNNWNRVTIPQFIELYPLEPIEFKSDDERNIHFLSILNDIPPEEIEEFDYNDYNNAIESLLFVNKFPIKAPKLSISTPAGILYLMDDLNQITIGEFIDLENLFTQGYIKNLQVILAILYRQKEIKNSLLYLDTFEEYGDWIYHRTSLFDDITVNDVYGIIPKYLSFRTNLYDKYQGLFDDNATNSNEESDEELIISNETITSRSERIKEEQRNKNLSKWNWDFFLYKLSKEDPTKLIESTKMSLLQALNILSMRKELSIE